MEFDDFKELIKEYIEDALEFVDEFDALLLQLEKGVGGEPDKAALAEILSQLHTFKGNSGMMGFSHLQKYTHTLEDLFKALQSGNMNLDEDVTEFFMQSANVIRGSISQLSPESNSEPELNDEVVSLELFISKKSDAASSSSSEVAFSASKEAINPFAQKTNVIKVDFERMDNLLNLMGELVIHRTRLGKIDAEVSEALDGKGVSIELSDTLEQMGKVSTELHEAIMKVRMLPIKMVFMRFSRLVRDIAKEKGKEIDIEFQGQETELDKTVIDEIGEPLMHLVRNSIDHGIEPPEEREKSGKPRHGTLIISAQQESSHIIITVEDDGRGIDEERLRKKAVNSGMLTKEEASQRDLVELIFLPGLSTAEKVSEVSGRGIGMDVVKKSLARINGSVEVETEKNIGTRFTIKLPLTLAIISVLMVETSGEQYAIPLASVVESIKVDRKEIHEVNHREVTKVRDRILPLLRLSDMFDLPHTMNGDKDYVVIVQSAVGQVGLIVDSLLGRQEIVIKALDDYIGDSKGVAGATILGDGKVVLILDPTSLSEKGDRNMDEEQSTEVTDA